MQSLNEYIARALLKGTRKHFSSLMTDYLQEQQNMSNTSCTTTGLQVGDNEAHRNPVVTAVPTPAAVEAEGQRPLAGAVGTDNTTSGMAVSSQLPAISAKQVDHLAIAGSNAGDHRAPNTGATTTDAFKNQARPRGETGTKGA